MGTPRPHVSRHVSGRAPRRGRRPRRPASAHHRIPVYSRLILRRGRRPRRPVSAHPRIPAYSRLSLRRGRRPRRPVSAHPRISAHSRLSLRRVRRPRRPVSAHLRIPAHFRLSLRRGRRPRRPVFRSPIAGCTRVLHLPPVAIFLSTAKEIWKRTPPKTDGFWRHFCPLLPPLAKAGRSGERNVPAPRPRTKRYPSGSAGGVSQFT